MRLTDVRGLLFCLGLLLPVSATAGEVFSARLIPRPGTGATGAGTALFTVDNDGTSVSFTTQYSGLTGPELASHIHRPDKSIAFTLPPGDTKVGVWQGIGLIDLSWLRSGQLYILVHTDQNPAGELRGDIHIGPLTAESAGWGAVKARYAAPG